MKTFSLTSFLIGLLLGSIVTVLVLGIITFISIQNIHAGQGYGDGFLGDIVDQAIIDRENAQSKSVYGEVQSMSSSEIVIKTEENGKNSLFTFTYDDSTNFTTYLRDDASTEVEVNSDTIAVGDYVTIISNNVVNTETIQQAASVIEI